MRVVVVGATGNVGTSLLSRLIDDPQIDSIVGIARRIPDLRLPKVTWRAADIARDDPAPHFEGADCVVHLAWLIQPSRDLDALAGTNIEGSRRVFKAVAAAKVPALVYASSVGAYSPGPKDRLVDESWPTNGITTSFYSRHKAQVERMLDAFEEENESVRVVRLRPALIFKREAASGIRRLFMGPLFPGWIMRRNLIPFVPHVDDLRFQAVHATDIAEAYRLAITGDARGAFNVAAEPVLDTEAVARMLDARAVKVPANLLRAGAAATWRLRLQPSPEGWVDMGLNAPLLDSTRANKDLGWSPQYTSEFALMDLFEGLRERAGIDTPPLAADTGGPFRIRELITGIGGRLGAGRDWV